MDDIVALLQRISTQTTNAFEQAVDHLNATPDGTVYAALAYLTSGIVGIGLAVNTMEHREQSRRQFEISPDSPEYWGCYPGEFGRYEYTPFFDDVNNSLTEFHNGCWDETYDLGDDSPSSRLAPIVQQAYAAADVTSRIVTDSSEGLLVGIGYADPDEAQVSQVLAASQALNSPTWHERMVAAYSL